MRRPRCPKHARSVVWLDGTYGTPQRRRQRYRCVPPNGDKTHVFTEPLPRQRTQAGHCDECERPFGPDEGAPSARRHSFTAREIAWALSKIGEGWSYRETTRRARERAFRLKDAWMTIPAHATRDSSTAEDWVEAYAPVVLEPRLPREWSSVVMLDDLPFTVKSPTFFDGPFGVAFRVYGALSYASGNSQLLQLRAYADGRPPSWKDYLRQLHGQPDLIVCDAHSGMLKAIREVWGDRPYDSPLIWLCHWHLQRSIYKLVLRARLQNTRLGLALTHAFRNERTWRRFVHYAYAIGPRELHAWLEQPDHTWWAGRGSRADRITWQLRQQTRGLPTTIQALETRLDWIKDKVNRRKFVFRNQKRTNLMLGLLLLHSNNQDDERAYARELRLHLTDKDGIAPPRHLITDPLGLPSLWGY